MITLPVKETGMTRLKFDFFDILSTLGLFLWSLLYLVQLLKSVEQNSRGGSTIWKIPGELFW